MIALVAVLLCAPLQLDLADPPNGSWAPPKAWEAGILGVGAAFIWTDVLQTLHWDRQGQPGFESNIFLGKYPSRARIVLVGGVLPTVIMAAVWYVLPTGWRNIVPMSVSGAELVVVTLNARDGLSPFKAF